MQASKFFFSTCRAALCFVAFPYQRGTPVFWIGRHVHACSGVDDVEVFVDWHDAWRTHTEVGHDAKLATSAALFEVVDRCTHVLPRRDLAKRSSRRRVVCCCYRAVRALVVGRVGIEQLRRVELQEPVKTRNSREVARARAKALHLLNLDNLAVT